MRFGKHSGKERRVSQSTWVFHSSLFCFSRKLRRGGLASRSAGRWRSRARRARACPGPGPPPHRARKTLPQRAGPQQLPWAQNAAHSRGLTSTSISYRWTRSAMSSQAQGWQPSTWKSQARGSGRSGRASEQHRRLCKIKQSGTRRSSKGMSGPCRFSFVNCQVFSLTYFCHQCHLCSYPKHIPRTNNG